VSHSYQTYFGFLGSDLNLDCGLRDHVIMRFASELGSETRSYPFVIFSFFSVPLSFSVFVFIFLFFVSASSKPKKKENRVIFHLVTFSNHISILKRKKREREGLVEI
jgi:hypothetical protein